MQKKVTKKKKENVKILFWNIAGLGSKLEEIKTFLQEFHFIGLLETWVEQNNWEKVKKKLPFEFNWEYVPAIRIKKKGRASGGILTGVRKEIVELTGERIIKHNMLERRLKLKEKTYKILTVYSRPEDEENIWTILNENMEDWEESAILVGGDFNARIGEKGLWNREYTEEDNVEKRPTQDRTLNSRGKRLIEECEEKGWQILNGNITGDEKGNFTYIGEKGASVIDYVLGNDKALEEVEYFKIEENINSDHLPLNVSLSTEVHIEEQKNETRRVVQIWDEEAVKRFKEKNKETKFNEKFTNVDEAMEELLKKIKEQTETKKVRETIKNKWWDLDCRVMRRKLQKCLKQARKGEGTIEEYRKTRKEYKILCKEKQERRREEYIAQIKNISNEKEVWKHVNKGRKIRSQISTRITMEEWREHFMELLDGKEYQEERNPIQGMEKKANKKEITNEEILTQIRNLKKQKSPGEDEVRNEAWIYAEEPVKGKLIDLIQRVYRGEGFPQRWRIGYISPIFKKGDVEMAKNYRGVTLLNTSYKIYAMVLADRLKEEAEKILPESQAGFRKGRSTIDNIFTLHWIIEKELRKKSGKLYTFFADLKSAFDNLDRETLWEVMERRGIDKELVKKIQEVYEETVCAVKVNEKVSKQFWTVKGVRQGCPLSPSLFAIYIAEIDEKLAAAQMGGVVVGREKIWTLTYADDMAMVARTEGEMKEMLKTLEKYLKNLKLQLNVEKSKMVVFSKGRGKEKENDWRWKAEKIEQVKEFTYLGYTFQKNNGPEKHIRERCKKGIMVMRQVWGIGKRMFENDFVRRMMLFDYLVKSVLFYGVEVWGWKEDEKIEVIQDRFTKWTLELDRNTPRYLVREETKRKMMRIDTGIRALTYEIKKRTTGGKIIKECYREMDREGNEGKWMRGREEYFKRNGWAMEEGVRRCMLEGKKMVTKLKERDAEVQRQQQYNKIENAKYNRRYIGIIEEKLPNYLMEKGSKGSQKIRARLRCGNEELSNRYWENEEKRRCRICAEKEETLEHLTKECLPEIGTEKDIRTLLLTPSGEEWMRKIIKTREKKK